MTPIDQFIREVCVSIGDSDRRYYNQIISSVARGFRDLNLTNAPSFKTLDVSLNPLNMIDWPADCIYPLYVGVGRNGLVINLSQDQTLTDRNAYQQVKYTSTDPGFISTSLTGQYYPNYFGSYAVNGEVYAAQSPANRVGIYNHFRDIRQTAVSGGFLLNDQFILTYKYDTASDGIQFIPVEMEIALRQFIFWEFFMIKDKGTSDRARREYKGEAYRLRNLYNAMNDQDLIDVMTSNYKSTPK